MKEVLVIDDLDEVRKICDICSMEKPLDNVEEHYVETVKFSNDIEADVRLVVSDGSCWTECIFYDDGYELTFSEPEDHFFGKWQSEIDGEKYEVMIGAKVGDEILYDQDEIQAAIRNLDSTIEMSPS